ncbi:hypothetical protein [Clostridium sp.]|uniref:hypothetical protein n=1 Tax=Clostridium sp. TaxID=1506 RepID=UPI003D6D88D3
MIYEKSNLKVVSDFEVRQIQKDEYNRDLIIPIDGSCVNLYLYNAPKYMVSRVQFPSVKSILIRFCTIEDSNICTVHFLNDSGIHSAMTNFEMDYSMSYIEVKAREFFVDMKIIEKKI